MLDNLGVNVWYLGQTTDKAEDVSKKNLVGFNTQQPQYYYYFIMKITQKSPGVC